jgi:hypothetical protein
MRQAWSEITSQSYERLLENIDVMKRAVWSIVFAGAVVLGYAQGNFTIVRPFDGAKVREVVKVLMPKSSIPDAGYVGIFLNGEFREAVEPRVSKDGKYYEYALDTKLFEDGNYKLELKLYVDYSSQPRIIDTSSIDLTIANRSSIPVPEDGISLRYNFKTGVERIYRLQERVVTNAISESDQKKGSRPFQIQQDGESLKMLYACDNTYGGGDGLVRMQIVPDKGMKDREYSFVSTSGSTGPARYYPSNMAAVYMRLTSTGREVFGTIPAYFGIEGNTGVGNKLALYASFPLPVLPTKSVRPGDTWPAIFQQGALDMSKLYEVNSVVTNIPGRGEFLGVEWEMGHPCAKIKNTISQGSAVGAKAGSEIAARKVTMEETIWFALDTKTVIKFFRDITTEGKADFGGISSGAGATGGGGQAGGGRAGAGDSGGSRSPDDFSMQDKAFGFQQGGRGPSGPPQGFSAPGAAGGSQGGGPGGGMSQTAFVKIRRQYLFVLEK